MQMLLYVQNKTTKSGNRGNETGREKRDVVADNGDLKLDDQGRLPDAPQRNSDLDVCIAPYRPLICKDK